MIFNGTLQYQDIKKNITLFTYNDRINKLMWKETLKYLKLSKYHNIVIKFDDIPNTVYFIQCCTNQVSLKSSIEYIEQDLKQHANNIKIKEQLELDIYIQKRNLLFEISRIVERNIFYKIERLFQLNKFDDAEILWTQYVASEYKLNILNQDKTTLMKNIRKYEKF